MKSNEPNTWRLFCGRKIKLYREKLLHVQVRTPPSPEVCSKAYGNLSVFTEFSITLHRKRKKQPSSDTSTYCYCTSYMLKIKHAWAWGRGKVCKQAVTIWPLECRVWQYIQIYYTWHIINPLYSISWWASHLHCCKFGLLSGNSRWL